jgi:hypothetical protein
MAFLLIFLYMLLKYSCLIQVETLLINANALSPEESPAKIANIQQVIMAINALSKVLFSLWLSKFYFMLSFPFIKKMFLFHVTLLLARGWIFFNHL